MALVVFAQPLLVTTVAAASKEPKRPRVLLDTTYRPPTGKTTAVPTGAMFKRLWIRHPTGMPVRFVSIYFESF